jgi:hypothetical protein
MGMIIVSLLLNILFFVLFSYQVVTKQRCMLGHSWSKWTNWGKWSASNGYVVWKQERVCRRCYKPDKREIGGHICHGPSENCPHRNQYLALVDSEINIKTLEGELGL